MEPPNRAAAEKLWAATAAAAVSLRHASVVVCPPVLYLGSLSRGGSNVSLGAQDVFWESGGAHTGEVSPRMLAAAGATHVIVGHSERRANGETDEIVNRKVRVAVAAGLSVIVCVGEPERDTDGAYATFVRDELERALASVPKTKTDKLIIAYEPIWAVGEKAAMAAHPALVREMAIYIRRVLADIFGRTASDRIPILYGGSVDAKNAPAFIAEARVAGLLVGRASLSPARFSKLMAAVDAVFSR